MSQVKKPSKPKPVFYSVVYASLKEIASNHGFNLLIHGSLNRDLDLVCIQWSDEAIEPIELMKLFDLYLNGICSDYPEHYRYNILGGGRIAMTIDLNRREKWNKYLVDEEWYLDISFTPYTKTPVNAGN